MGVSDSDLCWHCKQIKVLFIKWYGLSLKYTSGEMLHNPWERSLATLFTVIQQCAFWIGCKMNLVHTEQTHFNHD